MRTLRNVAVAALLVVAGAAFFEAGRCASDLRTRAGAIARAHTYAWRDLRRPPPPRPVVDVAPGALEAEEEEELAEVFVAPPAKRVKRVRAAVAVVPEAPAKREVEPEDAVRLALRGKRASFERCYELELKKQAAFSGFVVISLSVSADGRVLDSHVEEGNRRDTIVGACIAAAVRTLKLPALTSDADLLIPIRLEAKEPT